MYPPLTDLAHQQPLQASKWRQVQLLVDAEEMSELLAVLAPLLVFRTGAVLPHGEGGVSIEHFLKEYAQYIELLRSGGVANVQQLARDFACVITREIGTLYALDVGEGKAIIKPHLPIIQMQSHRMSYSPIDGKFRSMVFGKDSISWGIQFSYPQLFQDPVTRQILRVDASERFPNTALYGKLLHWVRHSTLPTPFIAEGKRINVPIRLGKRCFSWIKNHAQLAQYGLTVLQ
jgi:hypothetical protein